MNPAYLPLWVVGTAFCWLLPNHYLPWGTFHSEALMAVMMLTAGFMVGYKNTWRIPGLSILFLILACIVGIQAGLHLIFKYGTAWITALYFLGAAICTCLGMTWEKVRPGQPLGAIFSAILLGATLTIGLQLFQWLGLTDILDIWSMGPSTGRPFGNIGQPNQTATFLLWALISIGWLNEEKYIRGRFALFFALFILFGIALTYSRTAWIGLVILFICTWYWRNIWRDRRTAWTMAGLVAYFIGTVGFIGWLNGQVSLGSTLGDGELARMSSELRPAAWHLFVDAITARPWFGYGANQVSWAQLQVSPSNVTLNILFGHAHNLILDLFLWFGIPIGLGVVIWLSMWFYNKISKVTKPVHAWPVLMILIVGNHAMLELPLHYAYFLFPTCLVAGIASTENKSKILQTFCLYLPKKMIYFFFWPLIFSVSILLAILIYDYMKVESSYTDLRFELAKIQYRVRGSPPEVILLTQWHDFIELARTEPNDLVSSELLEKTIGTVATLSSPSVIYKLATILSIAGRVAEAETWLIRLCKTQPESQCKAVEADWQRKAKTIESMSKINWNAINSALK